MFVTITSVILVELVLLDSNIGFHIEAAVLPVFGKMSGATKPLSSYSRGFPKESTHRNNTSIKGTEGLIHNRRICRLADLVCQKQTQYIPPPSPVTADEIDNLCAAYTEYKYCYDDETQKRCAPYGLNEYVDQSCSDIESYKTHADCYTQVDQSSEAFVSRLRKCHHKDPKAVRLEAIHLSARTLQERCYMERVEVDCSRRAFVDMCGGVSGGAAFDHFHSMGGHHSWSNRCIPYQSSRAKKVYA